MSFKPSFIILFLLPAVALSQRTYDFDYVMEYQHIHNNTSNPEYYFRFTNSKDNSYALTVYDKDDKTFYLAFRDEKGVVSSLTIDKADFYEVETIGVKCNLVQRYRNIYKKEQLKKYDFVNLPDTIINNKPHKHYVLQPVDRKKAARKDWGEIHYIIQDGTEFHKPNLYPGTAAYEEWKAEGNIPDGIFRESYMILPSGEKIERTVLLQYVQINKYILFDHGCDYTLKDK